MASSVHQNHPSNRYFNFLFAALFPFLSFLSQYAGAQGFKYQHDVFGATQLLEKIFKAQGHSINYLTYQDIEGSPYLQDEFMKGDILITDSILYTDIDLRYDAYNESMQIKYKNEILIIGSTINIIYVKIQDQYFYKYFYSNDNTTTNAYFKLIVDGTCSLFARYKINFLDMAVSDGFNKAKPARFSEINCYYYINFLTDKTPLQVNNKKRFLNYINDKGAVEAFIKKENLKFNNEEDLIKIIKYYNSSKF